MSDVKGWNEPEVVAEYERAVAAAQAGTVVPWEDRAAYLSVIGKVIRTITRSQDFVQPGAPIPPEVHEALSLASTAVNRYDQAVTAARG